MLRKKAISLFLIGLMMLCSSALSANGQTAAGYIAIGRGHLASETLADLQAADSAFGSALMLEPSNQTANVLKAITRLVLLVSKPEYQTLLTKLGVMVVDSNPYHFTYKTTEDASGHLIPAAGATSDMVLAYVNATLLPEINGAVANLQQVTDTGFLLQLTAAETSLMATNVDYGDVQIALSGLLGVQAAAALANTQNVSVSLPMLYDLETFGRLNAETVLDSYPALLTYTGIDQRAASMTAFQSANAAYQAGSNFIRNIRSASSGTGFVFSIDTQQAPAEQRFRTRLAGISAALNGPTLINGLTVNLVPALTTAIQARLLLPHLTGNLAVPNTWPDTTMAGALPNGSQAILNQGAFDVNLLYGPAVTIAVNSSPAAGGYASASKFGGTYTYGATVRLFAFPNPGYSFLNWTENGTPVSNLATYSFPAKVNRTLVANFVLNSGFYSIATSASPAADGVTFGGGGYSPNATVSVYAFGSNGYSFVNWMENGTVVSTASPYTFPATANRNLVAVFGPSYTITSIAAPPAGGFTENDSMLGNGVYGSGAIATVTAYPTYGYNFAGWYLNGTLKSMATSYMFPVSANTTLVANFSLPSGFFAINTSVLPAGTGFPVGFVNGGGGYPPGAEVSLTAYSAEVPGYSFAYWSENGTFLSNSNPLQFPATNNRTLVANFTLDPGYYSVTTSASPAECGSTFTPGGAYSAGSVATAYAYPNPGYGFVNWTENAAPVSTSFNYSFPVNANRNLVANFVPAYTVTTSTSPAAGGSVNTVGFFATYNSGSIAEVTAHANPGYSFVGWSQNGNPAGSANPYSFPVNANVNLVANFIPTFVVLASPSPSTGGIISGGSTGIISGPSALAPGFGITVIPGSTVSLTATPNSGLAVLNWTLDGTVTQIGGNTFALRNVAANQTVGVIFESATQSALQGWRQTWYYFSTNNGFAADTADPYHTGIPNLAALAFFGPGQNPAMAQTSQIPQPQMMSGGNFGYNFTQPTGVTGVTYGAEYTTSLNPTNWQMIPDTGTAPQHTFIVPISGNPQLFLRLRVSE